MRSRLWSAGDESARLPTAEDLLKEQAPECDGVNSDTSYPEYAKERLR